MKNTPILLLALSSLFIFGCSSSLKLSQEDLETKNYQEVYGLLDVSEEQEKPDQMPQYPRGNGGLIEDIQEKQVYPEDAKKEDIEGNVIVSFTVAKNGELKNIDVDKSAHPSLDKDAVRIMENLQPWYPAFTDGKAVPIRLKTLVTYRLRNKGASGITQ